MNTLLKRNIMRRVYTAYAMRMLGGTRARHLAVMLVSAIAIMRLVSVMSVARNFSHVQVGKVGQFVFSALMHTESWTLIIMALFVYAAYVFIRGDARLSHTPGTRFA